MPKKRFNEQEIFNKIIESIKDPENIIERTVEILKNVPHYNWVGIYLIEGEDLVLKHYLGRAAEHTRIKVDKGICGAAVVDRQTIIVPDVTVDSRYIACSVETKSEIVVPIWSQNRIIGEIDIDSDFPDAFNAEDRRLLERIADVLGDVLA